MSRRYTVVWAPELHNDYAAYWMAATPAGRKRLTAAANCIDRELRYAPQLHGREVRGRPHLRLWRVPDIDPPVLAVFTVFPDDRLVRVVQILVSQ